jgi:hypothetical protein
LCAITSRAHDRFGADIGASARPVLDDEWLTEPLRQPSTDQASDDVGSTAGSKADDDAHRPRRIGLRPRNPRESQQRGRIRDQMQKISAGKFHLNLPSHHSITSSVKREQRRRDGNAQCLCGLKIDHQLEFCRLHHRQVGRLIAFEDACGIVAGETLPLIEMPNRNGFIRDPRPEMFK